MNAQTSGRVPACSLLLLATTLALAGGCALHPKGPCGPACPAIEAATTIDYPSQRLSVLKRIAARESLSLHEQVYLVNAISMGGFSSDLADALITLIENPCCAQQTRQHIAKKLKLLRLLGSDQKRVVDALIEN